MHSLRKTFRIWWQKPRRVEKIEEDRSISFLELFYDLAYVGIIYQITHAFVAHIGVSELMGYMSLYAMVWFAWVNGTWYHELHGNNDIRTRAFTFLQVFTLAFIGIFAPTAFSEGATGFALSYAAFLAIVTWLWYRSGVHDPAHRPLSTPYVTGFSLTILLFVGSVWVDAPLKFYLWAVGIVLALMMPILIQFVTRVDDEHREQGMRIRTSMAERFGLLTIIVLGEAVASVMRGASHHDVITGEILMLVVLALAIPTAMWWSYFDLVARRLPVQKTRQRMAWIYLHLPITMSIGVVAAGLLYLLEHPEELTDFGRWIIVAPVALFLLALQLLISSLEVIHTQNIIVYKQAGRAAVVAAALILVIGFLDLNMITTLGLIALLLTAPVYAAIRFFVERRYTAESTLTDSDT